MKIMPSVQWQYVLDSLIRKRKADVPNKDGCSAQIITD